MNDGQKYDGKESHANSSESIEQTAITGTSAANNETPQTEKPTLSANTFTFDELLLFNGLPDTGKTIIATLVNSGNYQPQQLSRALQYISQSPDTSTIDDEALQSALVDQHPEFPFTIEGERDEPIAPITVELPFFLCWQIRDSERTKSLLAAIERVFHEFSTSETGKEADKDLNQMMAYHALRVNFMEIVEKAAKQVGTYDKPGISDFLFDMPILATNDPELARTPVLTENPVECQDMSHLQEWVSTLQQMCRLQQSMAVNCEKTIEAQEKIISISESQLKTYEATVKNLEHKAALENQERGIPQSNQYISLALYLTDGWESEVELVREALADASQAKLLKVFKHIALDETEDAFFQNEQYNQLQSVLARISGEVTEVAINNHDRFNYTIRPQYYLVAKKKEHSDFMARKAAFVDAYSMTTEPDEDQEPTAAE